MRPPDQSHVRELILPVFTQWSKVGAITEVLSSLEQGVFYDGALLVDQMLRDDRIRAVLDVRVNSILGAPLHFEPGRDVAKARRVAEDAESQWWQLASRQELALLYRWGLMLGVGIARREWRREGREWLPTLKTWHPGALWYSLAEDVYYLRHQGGQIPILVDDPNWVLFTPFGFKYGRQQGLVRPLSMLFLARQWAFRDRARHSERHGLPFLQGVTPAAADVSEKRQFKRDLSALGTETVIVTPQGDADNRWDVELIEAQSNSHQVFSAQIDHLDAAIAIVVLGQSMSTTGQPGLGSQERAGDSVRGDIKRLDAANLGDLGAAILKPWVTYNYGDDALTPRPCFEVDPPADENERAQMLSTLGDAIAKLREYGLDVRSALEQAGVPLLSVEEAARLEAEEPAEEAAEAPDADSPAEGESPAEEATEVEVGDEKLARLERAARALVDLRRAGVVDQVDARAVLAEHEIPTREG